MNCAMKERKKQNSIVMEVGDILLARVSDLFHFMFITAWLTNHLIVMLNFDILNIVLMNIMDISCELKVPTTFGLNFKGNLESLNI